jgi:hypothetical protein
MKVLVSIRVGVNGEPVEVRTLTKLVFGIAALLAVVLIRR